jgi:hypothetical protein
VRCTPIIERPIVECRMSRINYVDVSELKLKQLKSERKLFRET